MTQPSEQRELAPHEAGPPNHRTGSDPLQAVRSTAHDEVAGTPGAEARALAEQADPVETPDRAQAPVDPRVNAR